MATDIILDDGDNADYIVIQANVVKTRAADFELDAPDRHGKEGGDHRRALVHNQQDGLTINYNGDYPAGVSIVGAKVNLLGVIQESGDPHLPAAGTAGDLVLIRNITAIGKQVTYEAHTLWLCVGSLAARPPGTYWQQVQMGEPVKGGG